VKIEEYMRQHMKDASMDPEPVPPSDNEIAAAFTAQKRLSSLQARVREIMDDYQASPEQILPRIIADLYGHNSPELKKVMEIIKNAKAPEGREIATAAIKVQQSQLTKLAIKLQEHLNGIASAIEKLDNEKENIANMGDRTSHQGIAAVIAFRDTMTPETLVQSARNLYAWYGTDPAAMGLLAGILHTATPERTALDLCQQDELIKLLEQIRKAAGMPVN